jgi:hypothetical protein
MNINGDKILMKKFLILFLIGTALCTNAAKELNIADYVKKYGKKGDHTEAFQKAFENVGKYRIKSVYIPEGTYYLNDTINLSGIASGEIYGRGYPEIVMKDPQKDIFESSWAWKLKIDGLFFRGGRNQLFLGNNNIDQTNIIINNCRFRDAGEFAIKISKRAVSSHVLIDKCSFRNNAQVLLNRSDWAKLSNSWITTNIKTLDKAVIVNYGCLTLDHVLGVPRIAKKLKRQDAKQRWIDNYGLKLTCRDTRFGGEGGGFPIVYNYRKYDLKYPIIPSAIVLEDCWIYCVQQPAVYCIEVPNRIFIDKCTGMVDAWALKFKPGINFKDIDKTWKKNHIYIRIDHSNPTKKTELPCALKDNYSGPACIIAKK